MSGAIGTRPVKRLERVVVAVADPIVCDWLARQALGPAGYEVVQTTDGGSALAEVTRQEPDLLLVDLDLPGLSGKDLIVAAQAQGCAAPVILLATHGRESDIIAAFRLGAADYLFLPARETEVAGAVERVMRQVRERRERERLDARLREANASQQQRLDELTALFSVGKAINSISEPALLAEKVLDSALRMTRAELGYFLTRVEMDKPFALAAQRGLPPSLVSRGPAWEDELSALLALSGEPLLLQGESMDRFRLRPLGESALAAPVKAQKQVVGLLVMLRKRGGPFSIADQNLLTALSDFVAPSLVNRWLFRAVEERTRGQQRVIERARLYELSMRELIAALRETARSTRPADLPRAVATLPGDDGAQPVNLLELVRTAARHFEEYAPAAGLSLQAEFPAGGVPSSAHDALLTGLVVDALLNAAYRLSPEGSAVRLRLERGERGGALLTVYLPPGGAFPAAEGELPWLRLGWPAVRFSLAKEIAAWLGAAIHSGKGAGGERFLQVAFPKVR